MYGMIRDRKEEMDRGEVSPKNDLFNQLIAASMNDSFSGAEKGDGGLTDEELVGNIFIFALAGHETSAHTLSFALAQLALNPNVQDWVLEEVEQVLPDGHEPVSAIISSFSHAVLSWSSGFDLICIAFPRNTRTVPICREL